MIRNIFVLLAVFLTPFVALSQPEWLSDGLVAYYPLDGDAADSGPMQLDGLARNVEASTDRFGRSIGSLKFNPEDRSRVSIRGIDIPTGFDPLTISFWFKIENPTLPTGGGFTKYPIFEILDTGQTSWNFSFVHQGDGVDFLPVVERFADPFPTFAGDYAYRDPFTNYDDALKWHHGVLVCKAKSNSDFYLDGDLVSPRLGQMPNEITSFKTGGSLSLGYGVVTPGGNHFSGDLDDLRIYGRALSESEVTELYQFEATPPPPVEQWVNDDLVLFEDFESPLGDFELVASAGPALGTAGYLDNSGHVFSTDADLHSMTVSYWFKGATQSSTHPHIMHTMPQSCGVNVVSHYAQDHKNGKTGIAVVTGIACSEDRKEQGLNVSNDEFSMVSVVYSAAEVQIYLDGLLIDRSKWRAPDTNPYQRIRQIVIGNSDEFRSIRGTFDNLRLYNRCLSSVEIHQLYEHELLPPDNKRRATAVVQIVNGFIVGVEVLDGGYGYTSSPSVVIAGGEGSGAIASATVSAGKVVKINIINPGSGYVGNPSITVAPPPTPPAPAYATAEVVNGFLVGAEIIAEGDGYTESPEVKVTGGNGAGAKLEAQIQNGRVVAVNVISAGSGYTTTPVITIASPVVAPELSIRVTQVEVNMKLTVGKRYTIESSKNTVDWFQTGALFTAEEEFIAVKFDVDDFGQFYRVIEQP